MAKIAFQQVTIVGTGLLGSSLGLALKRLTPAPRVIGCDLDGGARREARGKKAVPIQPISLAWSADGSTLFAGYTDNKIRVWGVEPVA